MRQTHLVYLSLGTNLGDRLKNLQQAVQHLNPHLKIKQISSIYETPPWGVTEQPHFYNLVLAGETSLAPPSLLQAIKSIEADMGRQSSFRWGPRLIDIDILFYEQLILQTDNLTIPHHSIAERAFVLVPLTEIAPDLCHPVLGETVAQLLGQIGLEEIKRLEIGDWQVSE